MKKIIGALLALGLLILNGVLIGLMVSFSVIYVAKMFDFPGISDMKPHYVYAVFVAFHIMRGIGNHDFRSLYSETQINTSEILKEVLPVTLNRAIQIGIAIISAEVMKTVFELFGIL